MGAKQSPESVDNKIELDYLKHANTMPNASKRYMYMYYLTHGTSDYISSECKQEYKKSFEHGVIPVFIFLPFGIISVMKCVYKTQYWGKSNNVLYAGIAGSIIAELVLFWRTKRIRNKIEETYPEYYEYSQKRITDSLRSKGLL